MALLETSEEVPREARQPHTPDPPVLARLLARDEPGTNEIVDESTRGGPRTTDRPGDLTDGRFSTIGDVMHGDELREGQLAPAQLVKGGQEELRRELGRLALPAH